MTDKNIEQQYPEFPPMAKEFMMQLLSSGYGSATDYSNRLKNALVLLMTDDELGKLVSTPKNQIVECCYGLALMVHDLDIVVKHCADFKSDKYDPGEQD